MIYDIRHVTTYHYRRPVGFGEHRLMLRPRDDNDQKVLKSGIAITPEPNRIDWTLDHFGNREQTLHPREVDPAVVHEALDEFQPIDVSLHNTIKPGDLGGQLANFGVQLGELLLMSDFQFSRAILFLKETR